MCLSPKWIYKKGFYKESNYRGNKGDFYELGTYSKCGSCEACINEKSNNWVIRNYYEQKGFGEKACFITLTYKENPIFLVKKDLQDFIKRFRYEINKEYLEKQKYAKKNYSPRVFELWKQIHEDEYIRARYFAAGEYGSAKGRPHFHLIIYGWTDENIKLLDVNKKKNILYKSEIIEKTWGLGRTTYQKFNEYEVPYIALYNTAQETFKKAYKLTMEKVKALRAKADNLIRNQAQRKNLIIELQELEKELQDKKEKYLLIKEFNTWSLSLGWNQFAAQYFKTRNYAWIEYIEGTAFVTPTPWVKKLANAGIEAAAQEMFRREAEIIQSATEEEEARKTMNRLLHKRKKEILDYQEIGRKNNENGL